MFNSIFNSIFMKRITVLVQFKHRVRLPDGKYESSCLIKPKKINQLGCMTDSFFIPMSNIKAITRVKQR
jgi:hypothetical protein